MSHRHLPITMYFSVYLFYFIYLFVYFFICLLLAWQRYPRGQRAETRLYNCPTMCTLKKKIMFFNNTNLYFSFVFCSLQVQGHGTALKILFSGHEFDEGKFTAKNSQFHLKRTEIVSLFNAFGRYDAQKNINFFIVWVCRALLFIVLKGLRLIQM